MRDYSKVGPRFWTGETGRYLRHLGRDAQVLGLYLFTCPSSNMIGLYYLPLTTMSHETGIPIPVLQKLLPRLSEAPLEPLESPFEGVFALYECNSEVVFVVEMAKHQIGPYLTRKDNRHKAVVKELEQYRKSPFFNDFLARYRDSFELQDIVPAKTLPRPFKAPSEPLRSQNQDQEQDQKQDQEQETCARDGKRFEVEMPPGPRAIADSMPFEQRIMAVFPAVPNRPNWMVALRCARDLVDNGLASWAGLVAVSEAYAAYLAATGSSVNIAAHNFFDRRKGNHWSQDWAIPTTNTNGSLTLAEYDRRSAERLAELPGEDPGPM